MQSLAICLSLIILLSACSSNYEYEQMVTEFSYSAPKIRTEKTNIYFLETPLNLSNLVETVLAVNPDLDAARQSWGAMLSEYPQAISYEDPIATYMFAPGTINSKTVHFAPGLAFGGLGQVIDLSQKIPFPGKLKTQGKMALSRAYSAEEEFEWVKVQLAQAASILYNDYYYVARAIEINDIHIVQLKEIKDSANAQCAAGKVSTQVPLQADLELGQLEYEQFALLAEQEIIIAKLNALLHRPANSAIPPPKKNIQPTFVNENLEQLSRIAYCNRPDLRSICAQINEAKAAIYLAKLDYYPDFRIIGNYNSMWPSPEMKAMIGVGINIPIQFARRKAAVQKSEANYSNLTDKLLSLKDQISSEISTTLSRIFRTERYIKILQETILPDAETQFKAVQDNLEAGKSSVIELIESEKNLRTLELQLQSSIAELYRQYANLDKSLGYILHYSSGDKSP